MKYKGKIFGVFQHLSRQIEFAGIGIGLAIVRNISCGTADALAPKA